MRSSYLSLHLSDHKQALRDLVRYALDKRDDAKRSRKSKKSPGYLCYSLRDYQRVYDDDSDLSLVKGCVDILHRYYDSELTEMRRSSKKRKKGQTHSTEEREILQKRDQEVSEEKVALFSALVDLCLACLLPPIRCVSCYRAL
jgi:hypothetical protein